MQRQGKQRHRQRRRRRSSSSARQQTALNLSASWPSSPRYYQFVDGSDPDDVNDNGPVGGGHGSVEDLRFSPGVPNKSISSSINNMVYQYVFEEGLELSLVPEHEAPPFTSGPKVLELGLSGFTGRLIITQQALRQYAFTTRHGPRATVDSTKDGSVSVISSSSSESEGRQPRHAAAAAAGAAAKPPRPASSRQTTRSPATKAGEDPSKWRARESAAAAATSKRKTAKPDPSAPKGFGSASAASGSGRQSPRTAKRKTSSSPTLLQEEEAPDRVADIAAVFVSSEATMHNMPPNVADTTVDSFSSNGVEVVSVASTVSTRRAAVQAEREDTLDQFASIFVTHAPEEAPHAEDEIDEGSATWSSSQRGSVTGDQQRQSGSIMGGGNSRTSEGEGSSNASASAASNGDPISQFATAFVTLSGPSDAAANNDAGGSIDDDTSMAAASAGGGGGASTTADSAAESVSEDASSSGVPLLNQTPSAEDPVSNFAAFVALSGPPTKIEEEGGSIDDDQSSQRDGSIGAASGASTTSSREWAPSSAGNTVEEPVEGDLISDFTSAFVALSAPPTVPEMALGSIDEESAVAADTRSVVSDSESASVASHSQSYESSKMSQAERPSTQSQPLDPISEFASAFGELSAPHKDPNANKGEMIDEESIVPSVANSSSLSSSASGQQSQQSSKPEEVQQGPADPMTEFVEAFGALTGPPPAQAPSKGQMIDEDSPSSRGSGSTTTPAPQSSQSLSSAEDPLTQFTKAYSAESSVPSVPPKVAGPRIIQAPQAPSESRELRQQSKHEAKGTTSAPPPAKRRASQKAKSKKATGSTGSGKPRISIDKKRKIREMFPNYPDVGTGSQGSLDPVGVYLHQKCAAPFEKTLPPKDMRELLEVFPFAAYCADDKGRLPLHVLGENAQLVKDPQGRQRATALAKLLIQAYPQSVTYPDSDGRLPFVALLQQWIEIHYEQMSERYSKESTRLSSLKRSVLRPLSSRPGEEDKPIHYDKLFPNIELWPYAEWCLSMLSMVLDDMVGKGVLQEAVAHRPLHEQMEARRHYIGNVFLSVPLLLKTVLFLDGGVGSSRKRILQMPFIRRAFLCPESVGKWLESMCLRQGTPSKLAIDYFQLLSETSPADYVGPKRTPDEQDIDAFHQEREIVYRLIEDMEVIIPSLVVLDEHETERAATTNVE